METKRCGRCKQTKSVDEFAASKRRGRQSHCKSCQRIVKRAWIAANRDKVKWNTIYAKYRLRREDYEALLVSQEGRCAVCTDLLDTPHVDHCHSTGVVRGMLCQRCNTLVGWIESSTGLLPAVTEYLAR